ncbi:MAG: tRNA (guanine-N7)-methyltransferase [Bacteroidetes bacterium]|nr:MAG: tRNA (guanine-N7)-methyltransferase [Bacteroidota bacterium]
MLITPSSLTFPTPPERLFGRPGPLVLEVGFGDGRYLVHLGRTHPDWNLLGAEVSLGSVTRAFKRLRREGVRTARLYKGHGRFLVRNVIPRHGLHRVYVNFPDPWPRKRHHKNRLLQAGFFRLLSTRLEDGGALLLTTDHAEYFAFACDEARTTGLFDVAEGPPPPATLQTKYALKWQAERRPIYHAVFTKTAEAPDPYEPSLELCQMQHALLEGDLRAVPPLTKEVHRFPGGVVVLLEAYRDPAGDALLFLVLSEEEDLRQEMLVKAWPHRTPTRPERGVAVALQRFGEPLTTRGAREAVRAVTQWLERQGLRRVETWF